MSVRILIGDCRERLADLEDGSVHCCVTSPPYFGLRDYGHDGQIGLESTPSDFVAEMVDVFREVRRVLRDDGTLWLNLGDAYLNSELLGSPWRVAIGMKKDGWLLRSEVIWHKPNPMPESVKNRPTKSHEHLFLFAKSRDHFYNPDAVREEMAPASASRYQYAFGGAKSLALHDQDKSGPGGNRTRAVGFREAGEGRALRDVWTITVSSYPGAHFATFPTALVIPCIECGCPKGGLVLDPFGGAGTTGLVADRLQRDAILIELNPEYAEMARKRIYDEAPLLANVSTE